ncbi:GNAT family N-acetyltransferase, partial [Streptomyces griseoruber]
MEPVTLTTDRLVLRPLGPQDTDAVHAAAQDPDIRRWTTIPSPY